MFILSRIRVAVTGGMSGVLLPATMKLLDDWNWYLPRRLSRLPATRQESAPEPSRA